MSRRTDAAPGHVRIIGGRWRGTRLPVVDAPGLRPSSDRVRETLFNWLQHEIAGARCLDLFAGSGVLGLEAASRGAARVQLIERDPALCASLRQVVSRLDADDTVRVDCADAIAWLARAPDRQFEVVFVDPPFAADLWTRVGAALLPWLAPHAWVYVESARDAVPVMPATWLPHRHGDTRDVGYTLYRVRADARPAPSSLPA